MNASAENIAARSGRLLSDTSWGSAVATLAPISLQCLNESAALQQRVDRKYVVTGRLIEQLLADLFLDLQVLDNAGSRSFEYDTVYFDTQNFDLYRLAATARRCRYKVRVRKYVDSGETMLEVKTKSGRGDTIKHRFQHDHSSCAVLTDQARETIAKVVPHSTHVQHLEHVLTSNYSRTTLLQVSSSSRATIDCGLVCADLDGNSVGLDRLVLETKSIGGTSSIDRWLWRSGNRPCRISKYATSVAILRPELPTNRWHRTIAKHF